MKSFIVLCDVLLYIVYFFNIFMGYEENVLFSGIFDKNGFNYV